jgi:hypothetical protein
MGRKAFRETSETCVNNAFYQQIATNCIMIRWKGDVEEFLGGIETVDLMEMDKMMKVKFNGLAAKTKSSSVFSPRPQPL